MTDPEPSEPQYVIDARTMHPGPLAKRYPAVAQAYRTAKKRAEKEGTWAFEGFNAFLLALGPRPSPEHTGDRFPRRIGSYEPGNVRWASPEVQANNRGTNRLITVDYETLTIAQWARRTGQKPSTIRMRLYRGWEPEEAVTGHRRPGGPSEMAVTISRSAIPEPDDWRQSGIPTAGVMLPFVPRIPAKYADKRAFPIDGWSDLFEPTVVTALEADFHQRADLSMNRGEYLLRTLTDGLVIPEEHYLPPWKPGQAEMFRDPHIRARGIYGDNYAPRFHGGYLRRLEAFFDAPEHRRQRVAALIHRAEELSYEELDPETETVKRCWSPLPGKPIEPGWQERREAWYQGLLSERDQLEAEFEQVYRPYEVITGLLDERLRAEKEGSGPGLWRYWRQVSSQVRRGR